jgi:AraC-like DNA-binding protein
MQVTRIQTDHNLMEINCHSSAEYPIRFYLDIMREFDQKFITWHWHPELEFNVVTQGTIQYYVENEHYTLTAGEGIMKNSNVLHMAEPDPNSPDAEMFSIIMDTEFIAPVKSLIYQKYIENVNNDSRFRCLLFCPNISWQKDILTTLQAAYQLYQKEQGAYELRIHSLMCLIWQEIVENYDKLPPTNFPSVALMTQIRLKQMISYIQANFGGKITLDQIASAARISKTACLNCFRSVLGSSPIEYVVNYRLEQALHLLSTTEKPVSEIGDLCGFTDASYFGKMFRRKTGLSPAQYRSQKRV